MGEEDLVEIFTTKEGITVGGLDFKNALLDFEEGDIEGTTTKIVDSNTRIASENKLRKSYVLSSTRSRP